MTAQWRSLYHSDLPDVQALAGRIHPSYPEDAAVFAERLALCPAGCLGLHEDGKRLAGYLLSHPWRLRAPPRLNTLLHALPPDPDCWYVHDIAIAPALRGQGATTRALALVEHAARRAGLHRIALMATGQAVGFWRRQGFAPVPSDAGAAASYGDGAMPLSRAVPDVGS
ncbi:GNAT family N-acetyltransferase [Gluconacetobacter entanii]|uniref:GNAT family N-acetyltransferase n=1 Tax=Gluconacetobacter entanii TaxID=108528 RepID=UPI001C9321F5|nr:GNAT family N-acetyltransferase [Gluconacetobacter entanii]MBY4638937.1 GNAT family N-acetyltransferase [Gluconacetobacter entanii]MCW4580067.1 GNAT family N-acetyltransferase [Gluconacetobacter entanii]MCW4583454.1 GNAT family N-acetyltransferase [Gluconacetobacter entanii]MCW4586800.1 GNAT family N-acetyltransferase [Gluconacetobacter entanii]